MKILLFCFFLFHFSLSIVEWVGQSIYRHPNCTDVNVQQRFEEIDYCYHSLMDSTEYFKILKSGPNKYQKAFYHNDENCKQIWYREHEFEVDVCESFPTISFRYELLQSPKGYVKIQFFYDDKCEHKIDYHVLANTNSCNMNMEFVPYAKSVVLFEYDNCGDKNVKKANTQQDCLPTGGSYHFKFTYIP